jgi:predicted ATPase
VERTRLLIEEAEAHGDALEDPLLLFSLLNSLWTASIVTFNGDEACGLAAEFLARAESQKAEAAVLDGYRIVGTSLLMTGDIAKGRAHFDRGITLCDPIDHNPLVTTNIGADAKVVMLGFRAIALWVLGYPKAALADAEHALGGAPAITPVGTLMHTLSWTILIRVLCGDYETANWLIDELVALADEKGTPFWKAWAMVNKGWLVALTGKAWDAVHAITSGIAAWQSTGATICVPFYSSCLAISLWNRSKKLGKDGSRPRSIAWRPRSRLNPRMQGEQNQKRISRVPFRLRGCNKQNLSSFVLRWVWRGIVGAG